MQLCGQPLLRRTEKKRAQFPTPHSSSHLICHHIHTYTHSSTNCGWLSREREVEPGWSSTPLMQYLNPACAWFCSMPSYCKAVFSHHHPCWVMLPTHTLLEGSRGERTSWNIGKYWSALTLEDKHSGLHKLSASVCTCECLNPSFRTHF